MYELGFWRVIVVTCESKPLALVVNAANVRDLYTRNIFRLVSVRFYYFYPQLTHATLPAHVRFWCVYTCLLMITPDVDSVN